MSRYTPLAPRCPMFRPPRVANLSAHLSPLSTLPRRRLVLHPASRRRCPHPTLPLAALAPTLPPAAQSSTPPPSPAANSSFPSPPPLVPRVGSQSTLFVCPPAQQARPLCESMHRHHVPLPIWNAGVREPSRARGAIDVLMPVVYASLYLLMSFSFRILVRLHCSECTPCP